MCSSQPLCAAASHYVQQPAIMWSSWREIHTAILVYSVSFDGFDGTGETTYTTARDQADKLADYIEKELDGRLDLLFAESPGCDRLFF